MLVKGATDRSMRQCLAPEVFNPAMIRNAMINVETETQANEVSAE